MRLIVVGGSTRTAAIPGISAAGADPELRRYTPAADAEILVYGMPVRVPVVPMGPGGCPTPAIVTRAACEVLAFDVTVLDAGLATDTAAPTVSVGAEPGGDIRRSVPVPAARSIFDRARDVGRVLEAPAIAVGETIPGGTTTALGVIRALDVPVSVSSSLPTNPIARKERVVERAMETSPLTPGATAQPLEAVRHLGDPTQAAMSGLIVGALESETAVTLAGGTQLLAVVALVRRIGFDDRLPLATTAYVNADPTVDLVAAARTLNVDLSVTDPSFPAGHAIGAAYRAGAAKEGVGMGWALGRARSASILPRVRDRVDAVYDQIRARDGVVRSSVSDSGGHTRST